MRFRRTAVPMTERAAAGVLCLVPSFFGPHWDNSDNIILRSHKKKL